MTDHDFEHKVRAGFRQMVDGGGVSPALRATVAAIPDVASSQRPTQLGWRFPAMNRFAPFGLAAAALAVAIAIGIALFLRPTNDVGPTPPPGPTHSSTPDASASEEPTAPRAASWAATGSMSVGRFDFTATLLLDGRVLVAGGDRGYDAVPRALSSAELYDPATGTWTATGSMSTGRYRHSATLLPNGKVLVAGGNLSGSNQIGIRCCLNTAELYDPATGTWTATGSMLAPRVDHAAILLPGDLVLVAGGDSYPGTGLERFPAELYNITTGAWTATSTVLELPRNDPMAAVLGDGTVLVVGGSPALYNPSTGSWSWTDCAPWRLLEEEPVRQCSHSPGGTATSMDDGGVLVADGETAATYDPAGGWTVAGRMTGSRGSDTTATLLPDGTVLVVGGSAGDYPRIGLATAEVFDPGSRTWSPTVSLHEGRFGHRAILLLDGRVLVVGGSGGDVSGDGTTTGDTMLLVTSAELYTPAGH